MLWGWGQKKIVLSRYELKKKLLYAENFQVYFCICRRCKINRLLLRPCLVEL